MTPSMSVGHPIILNSNAITLRNCDIVSKLRNWDEVLFNFICNMEIDDIFCTIIAYIPLLHHGSHCFCFCPPHNPSHHHSFLLIKTSHHIIEIKVSYSSKCFLCDWIECYSISTYGNTKFFSAHCMPLGPSFHFIIIGWSQHMELRIDELLNLYWKLFASYMFLTRLCLLMRKSNSS